MSHRNLLGPEVKVLIFSPDVCVLGLQGTWASACNCPQGVLSTFLTSVPCQWASLAARSAHCDFCFSGQLTSFPFNIPTHVL